MIQKQKLWVVVLILMLLAGILLSLPTLLSIAPLNQIVFNTLNRQVAPAELSIEKLAFGWFSKQSAIGLHYQNETVGIQATIDSVIIEKDFLQLLFGRTDPGAIRLESPTIMIPQKTISDFESERSGEASQEDEDDSEEADFSQDLAKALSHILFAWGSASFNDGQVFGVTKEGKEVLLLDQVQLETAIQKETSQVAAKLSAKSGRAEGSLLGDVAMKIPEDGVFTKSSFMGQGKLILTDWNLSELLPLAALFSEKVPFGRGRINGEWRMGIPSDEQLQLNGTLKGKSITLFGGFLKKDQPQISDLACTFDALRKEGQWTVRQLNFKTPLGTGTASGSQEKSSGNRQLKFNTRINIAPTLAQFPNTLKIRNDLAITNGAIKVAGSITQTGDKTFFEGRLRLNRLEGQQGGRKFVWKKPLIIDGKGNYNGDQWMVDRAKISSPFINGDGYVKPDKVKGHLTVDVAKTFKQARQFFKLPSIVLEGLMEAQFTAHKKGDVWDINVNAASDALGILSQKRVLVATSPFNLSVTGRCRTEAENYLITIPRLDFQSGLGRGFFQSDQMTLQPDGKLLGMVNATVSGNVDIGKLGAVYSAVTATQPEWTFSGTTRYETAFSFGKEQTRFQNIAITATLPMLFNGLRRYSDQEISLKGAGIVNVANRSASFAPINISATAGKASFESIKLSNWRQPLKELTAKGSTNFDLSRFASMYRGFKGQQANLAGHGEAMLELAWQEGVFNKLAVKGIVTPFKWHIQDRIKINEPKIIVDLEVGSDAKNAPTIKRLLVKSNLIGLNGTGSFFPGDKTSLLQLSGNMDANLSKLSFMFSGLLGRPVVLSGKKEAPFFMELFGVNGPHESQLKSLRIDVQLPANRIKTMGISLDQLILPMTIQKDRAFFDIKAAVNGGRMQLSPMVSLTQNPSIVAGQEAVFTNVRITQSMTDGLLTKLHPIFVGATTGQGAIGLYLEELNWPLEDDNTNQPICDGHLSFNKVALKSADMIEGLLGLLKAKRSNLAITSDNMEFFCQKGRVVTTPLTLKVDDTVIVLEGSMGFDQTLDFVAKTPITAKMVSAAAYPYLADSMITIPIGGTAENPQIDTRQFYLTLANLVKEAGGKALREESGDFLEEKAEGLLKQIFK